jgi:PhnB protein
LSAGSPGLPGYLGRGVKEVTSKFPTLSSGATLELQESSMDQKHSYDPADGFPRIMPSLRYDDVERALTWLRDVFGLSEHLRWTSPEGEVLHAEMTLGDAFVELAHSSDEQPSPQALGASSTVLVVMVKDVDSHYRQTAAAGARIIAPLEDKPWGLRQYTVEDLEGHRWEFSQQTRLVPPQEWGAKLAP